MTSRARMIEAALDVVFLLILGLTFIGGVYAVANEVREYNRAWCR